MKSTRFKRIALFCLGLVLCGSACDDDCPPIPNLCATVSCMNGGVCDSGDCDCPLGYEGATCGQETRAKFLGNYTGSFITQKTSGTTTETITSTFAASTANVAAISVDNGFLRIDLTNASGVFTVPAQNTGGLNITSGYGSFSGAQVVLVYKSTGAQGAETRTFYGAK